MGYDFSYYGSDAMDELIPILSTLIAVFSVAMLIGGVIGIVMYVLRSLSMHTISKRRGIHNAWLSWIPVGQEWIIGSLSDQYKYLTLGKNQSRRKILLILQISGMVIGMISAVAGFAGLAESLSMAGSMSSEEAMSMLAPVMGSSLLSLASTVVSITAYVFRQMSMYDLYKSCDPKNAVMFLVLGIFFAITEPFFLLACRNKDGGMPPRRQEYEAPAPEYEL